MIKFLKTTNQPTSLKDWTKTWVVVQYGDVKWCSRSFEEALDIFPAMRYHNK